MSYKATAAVWDHDFQNPLRKMIMLYIADCANPEHDWKTWHAFRTIAKVCNCSVGSVSAHMSWLVDNEYLELLRKGTKQGETNMYRLNMAKIEQVHRSSPEQYRSSPEIDRSAPERYRSSPVDNTVIQPVIEPVSIRGGKPPPRETVENIISLYNKLLPELPHVYPDRWKDKSPRGKTLIARWRDEPMCSDENFWIAFFNEVRRNDVWMRKKQFADGSYFEGCNLEWLLQQGRFTQVVDKCLDRERRGAA